MLNEVERNLQDAMQVVRNVLFDPRMLPGGGATELAIATAISKGADQVRKCFTLGFVTVFDLLVRWRASPSGRIWRWDRPLRSFLAHLLRIAGPMSFVCSPI